MNSKFMNKLPLVPDSARNIRVLLPVIICLLSILVLRPLFISAGFYGWEIESLDAKKETVNKLILSSASTSALVSMIPGDACSPIADKLSDMSALLTFILAVIYAEKYMMPILGGLTSTVLIPSICAVSILQYYRPKLTWTRGCINKLIILSIACMLIIPIGIFTSDAVQKVFDYSINTAIDAVLEDEEAVANIEISEEALVETEEKVEEKKGIFQKIGDAAGSVVNGVAGTAKDIVDGVSSTVHKIFDTASDGIEIAKIYLSNLAEAVAILLITNCVIPLIVLLAFVKVVKYVFDLDFSISDTSRQTVSYYKRVKRERVMRHPRISE